MKLVLCADQASNFSEMAILLRALAARGHECHFIFPYEKGKEAFYAWELGELHKFVESGVIKKLALIDTGVIAVRSKAQSRNELQMPDSAEIVLLKEFPLADHTQTGSAASERNRARTLPAKIETEQATESATLDKEDVPPFRLDRRISAQNLSKIRRLLGKARSKIVASYFLKKYLYHYFAEHLNAIGRLLKNWSPDAVILPEEIVGPFWSTTLGACKRLNISVIVTPYTIANQQEAFEALKKVPAYQTSKNWVAARLFPRWRMKKGGDDIVRMPSGYIYAHERLKLTPSDPWMMNSGDVDRICVESQAIKRYFEESGIRPEKLVVTGSAALDEIHAQRTDARTVLHDLSQEMRLQPGKPILLIGGCPNQLSSKVPFCEHSTMEEIVDFVCDALEPLRERYNLVMRPHPTTPVLGDLFARRGFHATMIPTNKLISVASLYIAFASATIRWAVACGVPTVNYDVFGYNYDEFKHVDGVFNVDRKHTFAAIVRDLYPGHPTYDTARKLLASEEGPWALLDGRSVERIESVIRNCSELRQG